MLLDQIFKPRKHSSLPIYIFISVGATYSTQIIATDNFAIQIFQHLLHETISMRQHDYLRRQNVREYLRWPP